MESTALSVRKSALFTSTLAAIIFTVAVNTTPSYAGVVDSDSIKNAVATLSGAATSATVGFGIATAVAAPSAATAAATAAVAVAAGAVSYTVVSQAIEHPTAAVQTVQAINPMTAPFYIATHPIQVVNGVRNIWNYLFG
jgi:hypothetical protein